MRQIGLLIGVMLVVVSACGCRVNVGTVGVNVGTIGGKSVAGSGTVKSESRTVADFNAISLNGLGKVVITQSGKEALTISAEDNFLPLLQTKVDNGTLRLDVAPGVNLQPTKPIEFDIDVKKLSSLSVAGAGDIKASDLAGKDLTVALSGVGNMTLSGKISSVTMSLDGAGNLDAEHLQAQQATVNNSGVGRAVVNASDQLTVSISGIGSVEYIGSPQVQKNISGLGKVTQRR